MGEEVFRWFEVLRESREQLKEWGEREKESKAQITRLLGARNADLSLRGVVVLRAVNRPGNKTLNTAALKRDLPDIAKRYMTTTAGSYRIELVVPVADEPADE